MNAAQSYINDRIRTKIQSTNINKMIINRESQLVLPILKSARIIERKERRKEKSKKK